MADHQLDDFIKSRIADHRSPVPADMWDRIREKKDKRRGFIFWIFLLTGSLVLSAALILGGHKFSSLPGPGHPSLPQKQAPTITSRSGRHAPIGSPWTDQALEKKEGPGRHPLKHSAGIYAAKSPDVFSVQKKETDPLEEEADPLQKKTASLQKNSTPLREITAPLLNPTSRSKKSPAPLRKESKKEHWWLDLYISPDIVFQKTRAYGTSAGITIGRSFGKHFSVSTGIEYTRIHEKDVRDSLLLIPDFHYQSIGIPLLAGYEMNKGPFKWSVRTGVIMHLRSWSDTQPVGNNYTSNLGLSAYLGGRVLHALIGRVQLFAEPHVIYMLSDRSNIPPSSKQKQMIGGLSLGVRYAW